MDECKTAKSYPYIKQIMAIPENMEVQLYSEDEGEWWYVEDSKWSAVFALVEYFDENEKEIFTSVAVYAIDPYGQGDVEDCFRVVPRRM